MRLCGLKQYNVRNQYRTYIKLKQRQSCKRIFLRYMGYGAIILQRNNVDQCFHPVYYYSDKTTPAESRYSSYELKVSAIKKTLKKFRVYLLGIVCTIVTDCRAFTLIISKRTFAYALRDELYF